MAQSKNENEYKMHWVFFFDRLLPWFIAGSVLIIIGKIATLNPLLDDIYQQYARYFAYAIIACAFLSLIATYVQWICTTARLVDGTLIFETGVINRSLTKIPMKEIAGVDLKQSFIHRIIGAGNLVIDMRGASLLRMPLMSDPERIQDAISNWDEDKSREL